jgi:hypothetical protein
MGVQQLHTPDTQSPWFCDFDADGLYGVWGVLEEYKPDTIQGESWWLAEWDDLLTDAYPAYKDANGQLCIDAALEYLQIANAWLKEKGWPLCVTAVRVSERYPDDCFDWMFAEITA